MNPFRDKPAGRFSAARLFRPDSIVVMGKNVTGWNQQPDLNARYYTLTKAP